MSVSYTQKNVHLLKETVTGLTSIINKVGERAVLLPFNENELFKLAIIDLLKKIYANMHGVSIMLTQYSEPTNDILRIPISLCLRGALSDCLTGMYLFTFSDDPVSFENEIKVLSKDYARYLKDTEEYILQYGDGLNEEESGIQLMNWVEGFKSNHPELFKSTSGSTWDFKKTSDLRQGSKYRVDNESPTEKDKFEWIRKCPSGDKPEYISLYVLFRYFSQHQHYAYANRDFIDTLPDEDFKRFIASVVSITEVVWAFSHALGQLSEDIKNSFAEVRTKAHSFLDQV